MTTVVADEQKASPEEMLAHMVDNCRRALNSALLETNLTMKAKRLRSLALHANSAAMQAEIVERSGRR